MRRTRCAGLAMLLAVSSVATLAAAQDRECETDEDCGLGFDCYHSGIGTGTVTATSAGGSSSGSCGDGICRSDEDLESCPDDCDVYTRCVLGDCDPFSSDPQCADGYECVEDGLGQGTTTSGPSCGDGACNGSETDATCPEDCTVTYSCQIEFRECDSDEDCADGFYCYVPAGTTTNGGSGSAVTTGSSAVNTTSVWQDVASVSGSTTSASGVGGAGAQSAPAAAGYCREEGSSVGTTSQSTNVTTTSATATVGSAVSGSASGTGGSASNGSDTGNSADTGSGGSGVAGGAGADGSGGVGDAVTGSASDTLGSTASSSGGSDSQGGSSASGSDTGRGGLGNTDGSAADSAGDDVDNDGGCSCGIAKRPPAGALALLIGLVGAGWVRRLSGRDEAQH